MTEKAKLHARIRRSPSGRHRNQGPRDATRQQVLDAVQSAGMTLKQISRALGRNDAYLQQYIFRGSPRRLPEDIRHNLASMLGVDQRMLMAADDPMQGASGIEKTGARHDIAFFDIHASAGGGAQNFDETPAGTFGFPAKLLRSITPSGNQNLRMITICGDSMVPVLEHGDIVMVDCAQTRPSPPGIFILDDGVGLVAKRLDLVPSTEPQMIKITSENSAYANYQRQIDEIFIIGRVVWFARTL